LVDCPPGRAQAYLVKHFETAGRHRGQAVIKLEATIGDEAGTHVTIKRNAMATFAPISGAGGLEYQVRIDWTPLTNEPLPTFDGIFRVQWDEEYGKCRLVLEGNYEPPLGVIGKAFDAAVGHRVAQSTMKTLLEELRSEIESAHRKDVDKT
jgi:hypothetical protein